MTCYVYFDYSLVRDESVYSFDKDVIGQQCRAPPQHRHEHRPDVTLYFVRVDYTLGLTSLREP